MDFEQSERVFEAELAKVYQNPCETLGILVMYRHIQNLAVPVSSHSIGRILTEKSIKKGSHSLNLVRVHRNLSAFKNFQESQCASSKPTPKTYTKQASLGLCCHRLGKRVVRELYLFFIANVVYFYYKMRWSGRPMALYFAAPWRCFAAISLSLLPLDRAKQIPQISIFLPTLAYPISYLLAIATKLHLISTFSHTLIH